VSLARATDTMVVVDEAYLEYGARSSAPWVDELENLVVLRTMSKAFGFAALRVGYSLAHPKTAALLTDRRAPAPISGPSARIAAAALRDPRLGDVETTIVERERFRAALVAAVRLPSDSDELRLRANGRAARRAPRGEGDRGAGVPGRRRIPSAALRERRPPQGARGRARPDAGA
jgi:hypothetical protein